MPLRNRRAFPESLAAAMADGAAIDWRAVEGGAGASHADLVRQLRVIAAMRGRPGPAQAGSRSWAWHAVASIYGVGVVLAACKVGLALLSVPATLERLAPTSAIGPFALNLAIFGIGGLVLLVGGSRDRRLRLLGGLYLTIAAAFVTPFLQQFDGTSAVMVDMLQLCRPEAFFALGVWQFAWAFPGEPVTRRSRRVGTTMLGVAAVTAVVLFVANVLIAQTAWPIENGAAVAVLNLFNRRLPSSMFWPALFTVAIAAVPYLMAKARLDTLGRRHQVQWFLGALALGFTPVALAVIATPFVPALRDPQVRVHVGIALYVALASVVPMTAYAVTVNRVMDLQFVIQATLRYALARYAIWAAILAPLTYLALDVFVNRGLTFLQYLDAREPSGLIGFTGVGLVALTFRPHLERAVDRWFRRAPLDTAQAMSRLDYRFRESEHLREISDALREELMASVPADRAVVLLLAEDGGSLVALDGLAPPLPRNAVLLELLQSTRREVLLDGRSPVTRLLPDSDQDWIDETGAQLLSPLVGSSGTLLGVVALGSGPDALPFTPAHVALAAAMCGHAALQLENRWLREVQGSRERQPSAGVGWQDEPAAACPNCGETSSAETRRCRCGAATRPAVLPLFVNAKFRLQRVLGTGGTGVVYLATDLALERQVAIKTLPAMRREYAARLRREARAMAAVRHPNLATIFGAEEWHDTPLLIVEYLEGGTLLDWLSRGPLPVEEALDLGIMLADALDRVHGSGVLHRDIKPSNIGYSGDGVPKLLDFGLAAMLDRSQEAAAAVMPVEPAELAARFQGLKASSTLTITHQVVGTPLYLSPEALGGLPPQESFDLWSLNMVLYEAVAGGHPWAGRSVPDVVHAIQHHALPGLRALQPGCPAAVAEFLGAALALDPARRPASAADLRTGLRALRARLD